MTFLKINEWEPPVFDPDPITDEEYEDVLISIAEIERGDCVRLPPGTTVEELHRSLMTD